MKIRKASKRYGVPRITLQDRLHGRVPEKPTRKSPGTILSKEEKQKLVDMMINMAKNLQLAHRTAEDISKRHAVITKESIQKWFAILHECLKQQGVEDILDDSTRILNGDETSFVFCSNTGKVIAPRGYKNKNIKKPVLVFVDGHKSHLTMKLSQYCSENQIILYALPPNTTHIMQPADVSVFKSPKSEWTNTLCKWQAKPENVKTVLTKSSFCPLLNEVLGNKNLAGSIKNGFRKCGLYPFCSDNVDYTKCVQNTLENLSNKAQVASGSKICPEEFQLSDFDIVTKIIKDIKQDLKNSGVDVTTSYNYTVNELSSSITIKDNGEDSQYMNNSVVPVQENSDENKENINHGMQTLPNVLIKSSNTISSILTDNLNTPSAIQKTSTTNRSINRTGATSSKEWREFEIKRKKQNNKNRMLF
ncbi:hypothetical protein ILUMI_07689 [Ignelater luminosus]|uniref:DDE-1 domain-containing protein n=1 Tax=Ignelater luminosus TaxID=2038154 RepID=A0A8K0GGL8_IGNLU|nr:hypothetical protein ILUMI_07689 [Ignelater luminosus]